jgi:hypothetical protein
VVGRAGSDNQGPALILIPVDLDFQSGFDGGSKTNEIVRGGALWEPGIDFAPLMLRRFTRFLLE